MKQILIGLFLICAFIGCTSKKQTIEKRQKDLQSEMKQLDDSISSAQVFDSGSLNLNQKTVEMNFRYARMKQQYDSLEIEKSK